MRVIVTPQAKADVVAIGEYIRLGNPERADSFVQELLDHCHPLSDMPRRYPLVPRYESRGIRRCVHEDYLIFYRVGAEHLDIVHILHGARDYESLLFPKP